MHKTSAIGCWNVDLRVLMLSFMLFFFFLQTRHLETTSFCQTNDMVPTEAN